MATKKRDSRIKIEAAYRGESGTMEPVFHQGGNDEGGIGHWAISVPDRKVCVNNPNPIVTRERRAPVTHFGVSTSGRLSALCAKSGRIPGHTLSALYLKSSA